MSRQKLVRARAGRLLMVLRKYDIYCVRALTSYLINWLLVLNKNITSKKTCAKLSRVLETDLNIFAKHLFTSILLNHPSLDVIQKLGQDCIGNEQQQDVNETKRSWCVA